MTIHTVDPIALRQKLKKLGVGPGLPMSQTFAEDAVAAFVRKLGPKRHGSTPDPILILESAELAYCLHNWAMLWSVPA